MIFFPPPKQNMFPRVLQEQSPKKKSTCKTVTFLTLLHDQKHAILEL